MQLAPSSVSSSSDLYREKLGKLWAKTKLPLSQRARRRAICSYVMIIEEQRVFKVRRIQVAG